MLDVIHQALRRGDAAAAERAAREGLSALPSNPDLHHLLAVALMQQKRLQDAEAALEQALMLAPERAAFHVTRAQFAMAGAALPAARSDLQRAIQHDPNNIQAYLALARIELGEGQLDAAEGQLKRARLIAADAPETLLLEGQLRLARNQPDEALNYFNHAARLRPNDAMVQVSLAMAYEQRNLPALAEDALRNAIKLRPDVTSTRRQLINLLAKLGRLDDARDEFRTLLERHPNDVSGWRALGQLQVARRDLGAAVAAFHRGLSLQPQQPLVLRSLHQIFSAASAPQDARACFDDLLRQHPTSDLLWEARFRVDSASALGDEVVSSWLKALPDSISALEASAQRADLAGRVGEAEAIADQVMQRAPQRIGAPLLKARAEMRRDPRAARARLQVLLESATDAELRRTLFGLIGLAAAKSGDVGDAVSAWTSAWSLPSADLPMPAFLPAGPSVVAPEDGSVPRLLWSLPGAGTDALCAAFSQCAPVLVDRFGAGAREDGLGPLRPKAGHHGDAGADALWRAELEKRGQVNPQVIDVLPHLDAEILSALPHARVVVSLADPRDLLLNWLAFGSPQRYQPMPVVRAAEWLSTAISFVLDHQASVPGQIHLLHDETLRSDQVVSALSEAAGFWGLESAPQTYVANAVGGLATRFEPGAWRTYADALAEPFAILAPVAARLGYPD